MKKICLLVSMGILISNYLIGQTHWKYYKKDSLGIITIPMAKSPVKTTGKINVLFTAKKDINSVINTDFFHKYSFNKQFFLEDVDSNVFYFHDERFYSLSYVDLFNPVLNKKILNKFYEKTIIINGENPFNKAGSPSYDGVLGVFKDSRQILWIVHKEGLYNFNDGMWKLFKNPDNDIVQIYENIDGDSSIWVTSTSDKMGIRFNISQYLNREKWIIHNNEKGFEGKYCGPPQFDSKGNIWVALWVKAGYLKYIGFAKYDGIEWTQYRKKEGIPGMPCGSFVLDKNDELWYSICNGYLKLKGIAHFNNKEWKAYEGKIIDKDNTISNIDVDEKGNIWFTGQNGVIIYNGNELKKYDSKIITRFNKINRFFEDRKGNTWIISQEGLAKIQNGLLDDFTETLNFPKSSRAGFGYNNSILKNYMQLFEDQHGSIWLIRFSLLESMEDQLAVQQWTYSYEGCIYRYKDEKWEEFSLPDKMGLSIFEDSKGNIWIDTPSFIYKYSY